MRINQKKISIVNKLHHGEDKISLSILQQAYSGWRNNKKCLLSEKRVFMMLWDEVWSLRRRTRTRENSEDGSDGLDYYSSREKRFDYQRNNSHRWYSGSQKWDRLKKHLNENGWLKSNPVVIWIYHNKFNVYDGHHRLAIAFDLGIKICPVRIEYQDIA